MWVASVDSCSLLSEFLAWLGSQLLGEDKTYMYMSYWSYFKWWVCFKRAVFLWDLVDVVPALVFQEGEIFTDENDPEGKGFYQRLIHPKLYQMYNNMLFRL